MRKLAYFAAVALLCTGIAVAQSTTSPDQSSQSSTTAQQPSSTNPSSNAATTPSSTDNNAATTSDQTGQTGAANTGTKKSGKKLPQTASPLPLIMLLGMGLIGAGGVSRMKNFGHR